MKTVVIKAHVSAMFLTGDERHVVCLSVGKVSTKREAPTPGTLTVIDVQTRSVSGDVTLPRPILQVVATRDLSTVFVLQPPTVDEPEKLPSKIRDRAALSVFHTASLQSGPTTEISDEPFAMALSTDEQWVYILDRGYHNHFSVPHLSGAGSETAG